VRVIWTTLYQLYGFLAGSCGVSSRLRDCLENHFPIFASECEPLICLFVTMATSCTHYKRTIYFGAFIFLIFSTRQIIKMSLYDGIEVETAPISPINITQAMEVDRESEKPPATATSAPIVTTTGTSINNTTTTSNTSSSKCTRVDKRWCVMLTGCYGGLASSLKFMAPQLQRRKAPAKPGQVTTKLECSNCKDHVLFYRGLKLSRQLLCLVVNHLLLYK